ncbi:hypothetical protein T440DRAFT_470092 [Plenodomus tracheiphilus IPT5]|uniref:Uncharacterized protein n=1 Tax=Plenodomus tracheiphilus IPT5 TaxID=1408161 RepID=A0A6A7B232_9PLEO|nr:hypothetical protein T440DRAFT_470092 [Plenodomus tracheiphilus IPT5]
MVSQLLALCTQRFCRDIAEPTCQFTNFNQHANDAHNDRIMPLCKLFSLCFFVLGYYSLLLC